MSIAAPQMYRVNAVAAQVQDILREYALTSFAYLRPVQVGAWLPHSLMLPLQTLRSNQLRRCSS